MRAQRIWSAGALLLALAAALIITAVATAGGSADPTSAAITCSPQSAATGSSVSCSVSVSDTSAGSPSAPGGQVTVTVGGSPTQPCALASGGAGASSTCTVAMTVPGEGGQDILAEYPGDSAHQAAQASAQVEGIDPTRTTLSCTPSQVSVGQLSRCVATVADPDGGQAITGTVNFSASPASAGTLSGAGTCTLSTGVSGASGACPILFTPATAGTVAISAAYGGDDTHSASASGAASVGASYTASSSFEPSAGDLPAGSGEGGAATSTPTATVVINHAATVSRAGVAAVSLSCQGPAGTTCSGRVGLTAFQAPAAASAKPTKTKSKPKTKTKTKTKTKATSRSTGQKVARSAISDVKHKKPAKKKTGTRKSKKWKTTGKPVKKTKPKGAVATKYPQPDKVVKLGIAAYSVTAGGTTSVDIHLSRAGLALLTADKGQLAVSALAHNGVATTGGTVRLTLAKAALKKPVKKKAPPKKKKVKKKPTKKKSVKKTKKKTSTKKKSTSKKKSTTRKKTSAK